MEASRRDAQLPTTRTASTEIMIGNVDNPATLSLEESINHKGETAHRR